MPQRNIDSVGVSYYLLLLDRDGRERPEKGILLSDRIADAVTDGVTDVFIASHGWKGDIPAANRQYDTWIATMAQQSHDRARILGKDPNYKSLIIGIHWPSLPWGKESEGAVLASPAEELADERDMPTDKLVDRYAERIADTVNARDALDTIAAAADDGVIEAHFRAGQLPPTLDHAYRTLFAEAGLRADGIAAAPGSDQDQFAPVAIANRWGPLIDGTPRTTGPGVLGFGDKLRDLVLSPVRQMSFWAMKHRARTIGERSVHQLMATLQKRAPDARFHLMGHSFGCIVVSAAIAGPVDNRRLVDRLPRPVDTLFLVQGAMSLWSFSDEIPFPPNASGFYRDLYTDPRAVTGPIVTTRSSHDRAVGNLFPLAARVGGDRVLAADEFPEYGGTGTFGIRGTEPSADREILASTSQYHFRPGTTYNIDASSVIRNGGGLSGAHSDINHDQVAHLFWQAALSSIPLSSG
jgi:hypothetical protein